MGKSAQQPPTPDYTAAATAQGAANVETARASARLSNPNIIGPYGTQTVQYGTGANIDVPTVTQTLTPEGQATVEAQQRVSRQLSNLGEQGIGTAQQVLRQPFNYTGPDVQTSLGQQRPLNYGPEMGQYGTAGSVNARAGQAPPPKHVSTPGGGRIDPNEYYSLSDSQAQTAQKKGSTVPPELHGRSGGIPPESFFQAQTQRTTVPPELQAGGDGQAGSVNAARYGLAEGINAGAYGQARGGVSGPNLQSQFGGYGAVQGAPNADQYGQAGGINARQYGNLMTGADMSGVAAMPVNAGMTGQQAIMNRLAPQLARQSAATQQQLANQGITSGSEAYRNAMTQEQQGQNDLLSQAALQGIGLDMGANQQGYGQAMGQAGLYNQALGQGFGQASQAQQMRNQAVGQNFSQGMQSNAAQNAAQAQMYGQAANNAQFGNAAQLAQFQANLANQQSGNAALAQNFGQGLQGNAAINAAIAQNYGQGINSQQLQNQAISQNFGQAVTAQDQANAAMAQNYAQAGSSAGLFNQAVNQNFNQGLAAAQFGNTASQDQLQRQAYLRQQPLNEISGLMSGSQIQLPQFQAYQGQQIAPPPIFAGAQAAGQNAMQNFGINSANANAANAGLMSGLGTAASLAVF